MEIEEQREADNKDNKAANKANKDNKDNKDNKATKVEAEADESNRCIAKLVKHKDCLFDVFLDRWRHHTQSKSYPIPKTSSANPDAQVERKPRRTS